MSDVNDFDWDADDEVSERAPGPICMGCFLEISLNNSCGCVDGTPTPMVVIVP